VGKEEKEGRNGKDSSVITRSEGASPRFIIVQGEKGEISLGGKGGLVLAYAHHQKKRANKSLAKRRKKRKKKRLIVILQKRRLFITSGRRKRGVCLWSDQRLRQQRESSTVRKKSVGGTRNFLGKRKERAAARLRERFRQQKKKESSGFQSGKRVGIFPSRCNEEEEKKGNIGGLSRHRESVCHFISLKGRHPAKKKKRKKGKGKGDMSARRPSESRKGGKKSVHEKKTPVIIRPKRGERELNLVLGLSA